MRAKILSIYRTFSVNFRNLQNYTIEKTDWVLNVLKERNSPPSIKPLTFMTCTTLEIENTHKNVYPKIMP